MASVHEQLTEQFYRWEQRGRGWQIHGEPAQPEPPFVPFEGHYLPEAPVVDDGRRPGFLSSLFRQVAAAPELPPAIPEAQTEPELTPLARDSLIELQTHLPAALDISKEAFQQFLLNLSLCREPVAFELVGTPGRVSVQFVAGTHDAPLVRRQLQAYFPEAIFQPRENALEELWRTGSGEEELVVEFGLAREFMFALTSGKLDPFVGLVGSLAELQANELAVFQVLWQPVQEPWAESIIHSVCHEDGKPFFVNMPELAKAAQEKVSCPLFAAVVRLATKAETFDRALQIACDLAGSLRVFADPHGNELIPLANEGYPFQEHVEDLLRRQSRRSGMILNSDELIGFVHLPGSAVRSPALSREIAKTKAAPKDLQTGRGLLLGHNTHARQTVEVRLSPEARVRHTHIVGASGSGKSTLLFNLIRQDIEAGEGLAVLDPHGDLIERILGIIPDERLADVILLDAADAEYSIGFNVLSAHSDLEKNLLSSDLISVFQRLSTSWGDQMGSVLQNAILALLESPRGGTLADLRRFLLAPEFRGEFLQTVTDPDIVYYWRKGFPQLGGNKSIGPVLTRLETFLAPKPIRYMVSQPTNRLDFAAIMDTGKVFLAKLPQGQVGKENAFLLGSLLVSKFQQTAMSRQAQAASTRRPFWLYLDEFQHFITPSMSEILTGARKYRVGLTLAHQDLRQLQRDSEVASAVLANCHTRVVFRVGDDDARKLSEGFAFFEARDLQNLDTGRAICRVERSDHDFNLSIPLPAEEDATDAAERRQRIITASREKYGTPRAEVEAALARKLGLEREAPAEKPVPVPKPQPEEVAEPAKPSPSTPPPIPKVSESPPVPPPAEVPKPAEPAPPTAVAAAGEDRQHTAIKERIRDQAESLDYTVSLEEKVPDGEGRIDIVLRRGKRVIAGEVSVTNTAEYEVGNVLKCLKAGFEQVAVICPNRTKLTHLREAIAAALSPAQLSRVKGYLPDEFIAQLFEWAAGDPEGGAAERGKPRKQKIDLSASPLSDAERRQREAEMLQKLREAMKRK